LRETICSLLGCSRVCMAAVRVALGLTVMVAWVMVPGQSRGVGGLTCQVGCPAAARTFQKNCDSKMVVSMPSGSLMVVIAAWTLAASLRGTHLPERLEECFTAFLWQNHRPVERCHQGRDRHPFRNDKATKLPCMMLLRHATAEGSNLTLEVCAGEHQQWALCTVCRLRLFHIIAMHKAYERNSILCTLMTGFICR